MIDAVGIQFNFAMVIIRIEPFLKFVSYCIDVTDARTVLSEYIVASSLAGFFERWRFNNKLILILKFFNLMQGLSMKLLSSFS